MKLVTTLHRKAMDYADQADRAKQLGDPYRAKRLFRIAHKYESKAASYLFTAFDAEPTRSVLFRSAASLALDCGDCREAERNIAMALIGSPPEEIAQELRDLSERVNFQRHLDLRGITLEPTDVQVSVAGHAVSHGMVETNKFVERVKKTEKLFVRTGERVKGHPFREHGQPKKELSENLEFYLSVPRAASFAVTLRVGRPTDQLPLPGIQLPIGPVSIIDETLTCLELYNAGQDEELRKRIPDEAYFNNFIGLARQIAPDGEDVTVVGFTTVRDGEERRLALTRNPGKEKPPAPKKPRKKTRETITVTGTLRFADSRQDRNQIILVEKDGREHTISVPPGMMSDIVRPLWEDEVVVVGFVRRSKLVLTDIRLA
ncbi:MAG: hypothetical protein ACYDBB_10765 [Armatimonadota bacterium]